MGLFLTIQVPKEPKYSLFRSLAYDLFVTVIIIVSAIKVSEKFGWLAGGIIFVGLLFFYSLPQIFITIRVHKWRLSYDDKKISVTTPNGYFVSEWSNMHKVTLRERKNIISWNDRLLLLEWSTEEVIPLNISIFNKNDIDALLVVIQRNIDILKILDSPSL